MNHTARQRGDNVAVKTFLIARRANSRAKRKVCRHLWAANARGPHKDRDFHRPCGH